ncbi:exodeoxyribonuclease V subunit alpha [Paraglaciecola aquimarina]|uniref:RecBCD enzyme subunit RecD n=1 Tax=Paraglaciecola algarum TaxID=3050085 RepID=A0ABS9D987_9ALTE|nr:exodeoxyribonuclease V subunit alpha [Paraglaciecola sp. G1-23]MCF2948962.1 exodeoxyribonuclease V subunit alpha [Paraglaciecola sp. G1-23]
MVNAAPNLDARTHTEECSFKRIVNDLLELGVFRAIDYAFAEFVYQQEVNLAEDLRLQVALLAGYVSLQTGEQHTCIELKELAKLNLAGFVLPDAEGLFQSLQQANTVEILASDIQATGKYSSPLILQNNKVYLQRYWQYEVNLAGKILEMAVKSHDLNIIETQTLLTGLFPKDKCVQTEELDWQKIAVCIASSQKFSVISGGPGTGKTTTVTKLLALLQGLAAKQNKVLNIQLAAPTGKAAARLTESIRGAKSKLPEPLQNHLPEQCQTIHRLLGALPMSPYFKTDQFQPLHLDVLVLDEASMVDLPLMAKLFDALPKQAQVILLGDQDQLASVETGSVLADICQPYNLNLGGDKLAGYSPKMYDRLSQLIDGLSDLILEQGVQIHANERAVTHLIKQEPFGLQDNLVQLVKSHRFSDDSGIGQLAKAIKTGDVVLVQDLLKEKSFTDINWYQLKQNSVKNNQKVVSEQILKQLITKLLPVFKLYLKAIKQGDLALAFNCLHQQQVLCAQKTGLWGVEQINSLMENELHQQGLIDKSKDFYTGRPVMLSKNDHQLKLFNGDIGLVMPDPNQADLIKVWFITPEGEIRGLLPSRLPSHETLYAMTIHKSQGSEFESVYLCLPLVNNNYGGRGLSRELLYTGLTRAKKQFYLFAQPQALALSLSQQCKRSSGLAQRLHNSKAT